MSDGLRTRHLTIDLLRFSPPDLLHGMLAAVLWKEYGLSGTFTALAGERDQNIRVRPDTGPGYLLKVASPNEDRAVIEFQIAALNHLAGADPDLQIPRNVPTRRGAATVSVPAPSGGAPYDMRVLTFVAGTPMADADRFIPGFIGQTGEFLGRLNVAFRGFDHFASRHFMPWNILNGLITNQQLIEDCLPDALRADCVAALARMSQSSLPTMSKLPSSIIHNDAHTGNILVDPRTESHVVGLIDFGDMVRGPIVQDVGTTLSSFAESWPDLVEMSAGFISGLSRHLSLLDEEVDLVFDSMLARLILTVQLLQFRMIESPAEARSAADHDLLRADTLRAIETLNKVLVLDRSVFTHSLRDALGR